MDGKNHTVLIADDEPEIRQVLRIFLEGERYRVLEAADGEEAVAQAGQADLILLDVMMPGCDGLTACARIRERSAAPILFLTAKGTEADKLAGLQAGGDDYLAKPFSYRELLGRVHALLRRYCVYGGKPSAKGNAILTVGPLRIDTEHSTVEKNGRPVALTDLEYRILLLLASERQRIFSAQDIYEQVWGEPYLYSSGNTIMVHIRNLRRKLEDDPQKPQIIRNVWGKGYRVE